MTSTARLWAVLVANLALVGVLVAIGVSADSVSVWAEGVDYLADAAAIGVSLLAIRLASGPASRYSKATRHAALLNAGWLLLLSVLVAAGSADRLVGGVREVHGVPVLIVSGIASIVMLGGALLLGGDIDNDDDGDDLNVRAVLLDTAADAATAAGVAATGGVIYATGGNYWLDPTVALIIAVIVGYHSWRLVGRVRVSLRS